MNTPREEAGPPPSGGYRALVENFPNGVVVLFDEDLRYRIVGPQILPFSNRKATDMVGKTVFELFPKDTATRLKPELETTIDGASRSFDVEYDNRIHHIETTPAQIDGVKFGMLVTQDVTDERLTEQELLEKNERLDQFASMMSHDLRNPLSIAAGKLDMYRETGDSSHLDDIEGALERIDELTADLLTLARTDTGEYSRDQVDLAVVARGVWEMIDSRSASLSTEPCTIMGDEGQLKALFENLFRNAVGHGGDDVTVRVGALENGFFVEDTGPGIPAEERDLVFEHGFSTGYGGSGVGLTVVGRIAEAHGWDVSLTESTEGGARFEFTA